MAPGSYKIPTEMEAWVGTSRTTGGSTVVVTESEESEVETSAASP